MIYKKAVVSLFTADIADGDDLISASNQKNGLKPNHKITQ
jgi:hypothetical protein